jgi:small conductance mechanosensitive channel
MVWTWSVAFLPRLITTIVLLIAGFLISGWVARNFRLVLARTGHVDETVQPVLAAIIRYAILIFVFVAALAQIGIQTASLFAVLGAAGLAIGLALQGTLTNIAAGIMLLWLRPFRLNDYIEVPVNNISGTVKEIGLFVCLLETFDGVTIFAPNSAIWNSALRNYSRGTGRLISLSVTLTTGADLKKAVELLTSAFEADNRISKTPPPVVFVESENESTGAVLTCGFHVTPERAAEVQWTIIEDVERYLKASGVATLVPQQITRLTPSVNDPSRLLAIQTTESRPPVRCL